MIQKDRIKIDLEKFSFSFLGTTESLSGNPAQWSNNYSFVVTTLGNSFAPAVISFSWNVNNVDKGSFDIPLLWLVGGGKLDEVPIGPNFLSFKYDLKVCTTSSLSFAH